MTQSKNNNSGNTGCGLIGVLQIIFIVMKLAAPESAIYKWSWIVVLIPLWISLGICGIACILFCFAGGCVVCINTFNEPQKDLENGRAKRKTLDINVIPDTTATPIISATPVITSTPDIIATPVITNTDNDSTIITTNETPVKDLESINNV